jgi:hypothetical protein
MKKEREGRGARNGKRGKELEDTNREERVRE